VIGSGFFFRFLILVGVDVGFLNRFSFTSCPARHTEAPTYDAETVVAKLRMRTRL